MYQGLKEVKFNVYTDKTIASGVRYQKLHHYQCEHCGYVAQVSDKAVEPFYCHCLRLHNIMPEAQRDWPIGSEVTNEQHRQPERR